jgi:hypothetical protein
MRSFTRRGHAYRLHVYDQLDVPEGVELADASELIPRAEIFYFENRFTGRPDIGPFSDLFRYKLLLAIGGWYVDADTFCMSDTIPDGVRAWAEENKRVERKTVINGAQMCLPKGDPLAAELYQRCLALGRTSAAREDWGPNLLSRVIPALGLPSNLFGSTETFYPIDWISAFALVLPSYRRFVEAKTAQALFLTAYQSFFQYAGIELARTPPAGSFLRRQYEELAVGQMTSNEYRTSEVEGLVRAFVLANRDWAVPQLVNSLGTQILEELSISTI